MTGRGTGLGTGRGSTRAMPAVVVAVMGMQIATTPATASDAATFGWERTFGVGPGPDGRVQAFTTFDDGRGAAVYAAGWFRNAGHAASPLVARWDGDAWSSLGAGLTSVDLFSQNVRDLIVFDDGRGPALYAAGSFDRAGDVPVASIARWDGTVWSDVGGGVDGQIFDLEILPGDDDRGPRLIAVGDFDTAGDGTVVNDVALWDGTSWSGLGSGLNNRAFSAATMTTPDGDATLYVAGFFQEAGGVPAVNIAQWDGKSWAPLGSELEVSVGSLVVYDDGAGGGPALYARGSFPDFEGVGRWNGETWTEIGSRFDHSIFVLHVHDDGRGDGPALYAGGQFDQAEGQSIRNLARWDGATWSAVSDPGPGNADGLGSVWALASSVDPEDGAPLLLVGGSLDQMGTSRARNVFGWDGASARVFGAGVAAEIDAMTVHDDGTGPALHAVGVFVFDDDSWSQMARWDGRTWTPIPGADFDSPVRTMISHDDGRGEGAALYVAGSFTSVGGMPASRIARWDGSAWSALGFGLSDFVVTLAVHDDGTTEGPALYAGGQFTFAGTTLAPRVARWDGETWSGLGTGVSGSVVWALASYDEGDGPRLFVGGRFDAAGEADARDIARWDGRAWSSVGTGLPDLVTDLMVADDGDRGPTLFAAGEFQCRGWDGETWTPLPGALFGNIESLGVLERPDGIPNELLFTGELGSGIMRWNGRQLISFDPGVSGDATLLTMFDAGDGPALYVGGDFQARPDGDEFVARWRPGPVDPLGDVTGDDAVDEDDVWAVLFAWGACVTCADCPADLDGDCDVGWSDLLIILTNWT